MVYIQHESLYHIIKYSALQVLQSDAWYYPHLFEATNMEIIGGDTDRYENGGTTVWKHIVFQSSKAGEPCGIFEDGDGNSRHQ